MELHGRWALGQSYSLLGLRGKKRSTHWRPVVRVSKTCSRRWKTKTKIKQINKIPTQIPSYEYILTVSHKSCEDRTAASISRRLMCQPLRCSFHNPETDRSSTCPPPPPPPPTTVGRGIWVQLELVRRS